MKKGCVAILVLLVLFASLVSAEEIKTEATNIDFTTSQVYPEPVEPGKDVTIKVTLKNQDELDADGVKVLPRVVYPFQLKSQEENWWRGFNLCAQCSRENTYYVLIDPKAESGTYPLIFDVTKGPIKMTRNVNVKVEGVPDVILLTDTAKPILVEPKTQFETGLIIKNIGTGTARNLKISSQSDEFITSGSNTQFIEELGVGKEVNLSAYFTGSEDLEPNVYNLPIAVEYKDTVGNALSYQGNLGVIVKNKAELSVKNIKTRPAFIMAGDKYELSLRVENTGTGDAKNTHVKIVTSVGDMVTQYIGQLKKDEDSSVVTSLMAVNDKFTKSTINRIEIKLTYEDDLGSHEITEQMLIEVRPNTKYFWYLFYFLMSLAVILVVLLYYLYQKKKEQMENRFEEVIEYGLAEEFVRNHDGYWTDKHFNNFLKELKSKDFHLDKDRLRRYLEKVRVEHKRKNKDAVLKKR